MVHARPEMSAITFQLFGVEVGDPTTYLVVVLGFATFALLSAWVPARRATRVDTVETLTAE